MAEKIREPHLYLTSKLQIISHIVCSELFNILTREVESGSFEMNQVVLRRLTDTAHEIAEHKYQALALREHSVIERDK